MGGVRFPLPARDRILLHLSDLNISPAEEGSYPPSLTQDGIAFRTGLGRAHVALALKSLREEGLVEEVKGRVAGEARRRKVYALSEPGRNHCRSLLSVIMEMDVAVRAEGAQEKRTKLSEASFILPKKVTLIDLALSVGENGSLVVGASGLPVHFSEAEEAVPEETDKDAAEAAPQGKAIASAGRPSPPAPPSPASVFISEGPDETQRALPPAPAVPPWVRWGQLAAVWIGAVVLACVFIWLGVLLEEPVPPEFLVLYFLVMVSLQAVIIGLDKIPAEARAEMGLFLGLFLALYGGLQALGPPFSSLLWFTEGVLLLSTGLLVHSLDNDHRFRTAGAAVGAFIIILGVQWMLRFVDPTLRLFCILWMPVGALLLAARFHSGTKRYTAHFKTAAGISAGFFLMTIGAFLVRKGFTAESFVEFLVGSVLIYYTAPKKREEWDGVLIATTLIMCIMVVATTFFVLDQFLGRLSYFQGN